MSKFRQDDKHLIEQIRRIINHYDPEGLDAGKIDGAPDDEYGAETTPIAAFFMHNQETIKLDPSKLVDEINRIWSKQFGRNCATAESIAEHIIQKLM